MEAAVAVVVSWPMGVVQVMLTDEEATVAMLAAVVVVPARALMIFCIQYRVALEELVAVAVAVGSTKQGQHLRKVEILSEEEVVVVVVPLTA